MLKINGDIAGLIHYAEALLSLPELLMRLDYLHHYGDAAQWDVVLDIVQLRKGEEGRLSTQEWDCSIVWVNPRDRTSERQYHHHGAIRIVGGLVPHLDDRGGSLVTATWGIHT